MLCNEIAVAARAYRNAGRVMGRPFFADGGTVDRKWLGHFRIRDQLTDQRHEQDQPHGDEAKPCGAMFSGATGHDVMNDVRE